jgi:hypothetical protein
MTEVLFSPAWRIEMDLAEGRCGGAWLRERPPRNAGVAEESVGRRAEAVARERDLDCAIATRRHDSAARRLEGGAVVRAFLDSGPGSRTDANAAFGGAIIPNSHYLRLLASGLQKRKQSPKSASRRPRPLCLRFLPSASSKSWMLSRVD